MHRRWWLAVPVAGALALATPAAAYASIGVGIQAGPVRLAGAAHPGGSYSLPPVYVVNTGTQDESVAIRVERVSPGTGLTVPPSWVHATGPAVNLTHGQSARIPLELVVPATAKRGVYFSDVVAKGSATIGGGEANLGVAAATQLKFRIAPGVVSRSWFGLPGWFVPAILGLLALAAGIVVVRRSGVRVRIERQPAGAGSSAGAGSLAGGEHDHVA